MKMDAHQGFDEQALRQARPSQADQAPVGQSAAAEVLADGDHIGIADVP
jgi:hypothetical protein